MDKLTTSYRDDLLKDLQDLIEAAAYLNAALEDGSEEMFLMALRDVAEARGKVKLKEPFVSNHEEMDKLLSEKNTAQLNEFLKSMGLKLAIEVEVPLVPRAIASKLLQLFNKRRYPKIEIIQFQ